MKHQIEISECRRDCFCKDCDNICCLHHGKREADCPKYKCDSANKFDCDNCKWLDEWYKEMESDKDIMDYPQVDGITPTVIGKETEDAEIH